MSTEQHLLALNERAAQLLLESLEQAQLPVLCADADWPTRPRPHLTFWRRRGAEPTDFSIWERRYAGALLGLPRGREELAMNVHLMAARMLPEAPLVLFGLKEAGIVAAERVLQDVFETVTLALTKHHGRVFIARNPRVDSLIDNFDDWRRAHAITLMDKEISLVSYPGVFARGQLDGATALLIAHLSQIPAPATVLDYACGAGVLALAARQLWPNARVHLLDNDALALRAARANVPEGEYLQSESLSVCEARYDLILSNPPIHDGTRQSYDIVEKLVTDAPKALSRNGKLLLVTQQTVPVQRWAKTATVLTQEQGFRVWLVGG